MNSLFHKLAAAEEAFFASRFLAPIIMGRPVVARIDGVAVTFRVVSRKSGWGIYKPVTSTEAVRVRRATMVERQSYLDLLPKLRLILCRQSGNRWFGINAFNGDARFRISGSIPVELTEEVQMFDQVCCRWDGSTCWFDAVEHDRHSQEMRDALAKKSPSKDVRHLLIEHQVAYITALGDVQEEERRQRQMETEARLATTEGRIKDALTRAGAEYRGHVDRGNVWSIEYVVDGERHRSTVEAGTMGVVSAGICLDGGDALQDLNSLIHVIRSGRDQGLLVRVGENVR